MSETNQFNDHPATATAHTASNHQILEVEATAKEFCAESQDPPKDYSLEDVPLRSDICHNQDAFQHQESTVKRPINFEDDFGDQELVYTKQEQEGPDGSSEEDLDKFLLEN